MEMEFEEFDIGPVEQDADRIHVSINRRGNFYVNGRAIKAMGEPDAVVLMYDRRRQTIGMKRAPLGRRNAFRLKKKDDHVGGRVLYAANFCRHYHISPDETLAFTAAEVDKNGVLMLNLNEVRTAKRY